jgi:hypothetical protein
MVSGQTSRLEVGSASLCQAALTAQTLSYLLTIAFHEATDRSLKGTKEELR